MRRVTVEVPPRLKLKCAAKGRCSSTQIWHRSRLTVMEVTGGDGVGRLLECTGAEYMVNNCFSLLRKGGYIGMIGLPKTPIHVEKPLENVVFKSLTLKTVHGRKIFHTWEETERIFAEKKINTDLFVTHDVPMSQFEEAFKVLMTGEGCKVLISPEK